MAHQEIGTIFVLLQIFGVWTPEMNKNNVFLYGLYYLWRAVAMLLIWSLSISLFTDLFKQNNVEGMTRNFLLSTVMLCCILKVSVLLLKRREIIEMLNLFRLPCCLPKTAAEHNILTKYRRNTWIVGGGFLLLCFLTLLMQFSAAFFYAEGIKRRSLPYSIWHPWSIEPIVSYVLTCVYLAVSSLVSMPVTIAIDSLIYGCMVLACSHLEILKMRLARVHTLADLKICVQQHNIIFQYAERIGDIFGIVAFVQFLLSMLNICSVMIVIVKSDTEAGSVVSVFFLSCMMIQVLLYCWYGNEIFLKSQSIIGAPMENENYVNLPVQIRKGLLEIMIRAQKPAEIKAARMLTLSLDTFMMILKASYSAFNLLLQVSNK